MLRKQLKARNAVLRLRGMSRHLERAFRLNGLGYLLHVRVEEVAQRSERAATIYGQLSPLGPTVSPPISPLHEGPNGAEDAAAEQPDTAYRPNRRIAR